MMTPQEKFDIVAKHLFTQGCRALSPTGISCRYRGENGTKCAFGILIPDELYNSDLEGRNVFHFKKNHAFEGIIGDDFNLLIDLQSLHDGSSALRKEISERSDDVLVQSEINYLTDLENILKEVAPNPRSSSFNMQKLKEGLELIANHYNLDTSVLDAD